MRRLVLTHESYRAFFLEQRLLALKRLRTATSTEAAERAVGSDDPMAGNLRRERIMSQSLSDRLRGTTADPPSEFAVADRRSPRNIEKLQKNAQTKRGLV